MESQPSESKLNQQCLEHPKKRCDIFCTNDAKFFCSGCISAHEGHHLLPDSKVLFLASSEAMIQGLEAEMEIYQNLKNRFLEFVGNLDKGIKELGETIEKEKSDSKKSNEGLSEKALDVLKKGITSEQISDFNVEKTEKKIENLTKTIKVIEDFSQKQVQFLKDEISKS